MKFILPYSILVLIFWQLEQGISGVYRYSMEIPEFSRYGLTLDLKTDGCYKYKSIDDQFCYATRKLSEGKWKAKGDTIILMPSSTFKPKIKKEYSEVDSLLIKYRSSDSLYDNFRGQVFFLKEGKEVFKSEECSYPKN